MRDLPASPAADFSACLCHEDAAVRSRAWAWQSALSLLQVEGLAPSPYLLESARRHIEGALPLSLISQLLDIFYSAHPAPPAQAADRRALDMARLLAEGLPPASGAPAPPPAPSAPSPPPQQPLPESAEGLHNRQKRLLRTLGARVLSVPDLLHALRLSSRQSFMKVWLAPALEYGLVKASHPESPRHPQQQYLLTRKGQRFLKQLIRK